MLELHGGNRRVSVNGHWTCDQGHMFTAVVATDLKMPGNTGNSQFSKVLDSVCTLK